jgi:hypothetical protein
MSRNLTFGAVLTALALSSVAPSAGDAITEWSTGLKQSRMKIGNKGTGAARAKRIARKHRNIRARAKK